MARSRNLKPGFFKNEELAQCSAHARLLFAGLWLLADREGRLEDRPQRIRAELFPYEMRVNVDKLLSELEQHGFVQRYEADGQRCMWITGFHKHQTPHHMEEPSRLPPPDGVENRYNHSPITKEQRNRIFERDGQKCVECGSGRQLQIDHIVPVSRGGSSDDDNLRTLCRKCNEKKGNRDRLENESTSTQHQIDGTTSTYIGRGNKESGKGNRESGSRNQAFEPPSVDDVRAYCESRNSNVDPQQFVDFYTSKGWKVGHQPMKDWQAAIRTWERNPRSSGRSSRDPRGNLETLNSYLQRTGDGSDDAQTSG